MNSVYSSPPVAIITDKPYEHVHLNDDKKRAFIVDDSIDTLAEVYPEFVTTETYYDKKTGKNKIMYIFDFEKSEEEVPFNFDYTFTLGDYKYTKILQHNGSIVVYVALPKHSSSSSWHILYSTNYFRRGNNSDEIIYEARL